MGNKGYNSIETFRLAVIENPELACKNLYTYYRSDFIRYARNYIRNETIIKDAFQEAVIITYQNVLEDKIKYDNCTLKTYLFGVGKKVLSAMLRKENNYRTAQHGWKIEEDNAEAISLDEEVMQGFALLGDTCKKIITLFYYRRYSVEAIAHTLNMKNENSVKANKSRCIKELRKHIDTITKKNEDK